MERSKVVQTVQLKAFVTANLMEKGLALKLVQLKASVTGNLMGKGLALKLVQLKASVTGNLMEHGLVLRSGLLLVLQSAQNSALAKEKKSESAKVSELVLWKA